MKKLFAFLSIVFALLAGFSACGSVKTDINPDSEIADSDGNDEDSGNTGNDEDSGNTGDTGNTEYPDNTLYGIEYCVFIKVSGVVTNEESLPLENIDVNVCDHYGKNCNLETKTGKNGEFEVTQSLDYVFDIPSNLSLMFKDSDSKYSENNISVVLECEEQEGEESWIMSADCKNEDVKVVMEETSDDDTDSDI